MDRQLTFYLCPLFLVESILLYWGPTEPPNGKRLHGKEFNAAVNPEVLVTLNKYEVDPPFG